MSRILKTTGIILISILILLAIFFFWAKSPTVPESDYNTLYQATATDTGHRNDSLLHVVTYNIGYLSGMTNNTPQRPTREFYANNEKRIIPALRALNADIVGFQEIDFNSERSYRTDQAKMICDSLFQYGAFAVNWDKRYVPFPMWPPKVHFGKVLSGQAVMSAYPLPDQEVRRLEKVKSNPFYYNALYLDRLAQIVTVNHPVKPFKVINLHAEAFDAETRRRQLNYIYDLFWELEKEYPVILLGDFNSDPDFPNAEIDIFLNDIRFSIAAFDRSTPATSFKTYPSVNADERLDYIFLNTDRFELIDSRVLQEFGDIYDHLPCMSVLRIK